VIPNGAPIESAEIRLERAEFGDVYRGVGDSLGKFEVKGLPTGKYKVYVSSVGGFFYTILDQISVTAGDKLDLGDVVLVLSNAIRRVARSATRSSL
jgi:hypothetical protein